MLPELPPMPDIHDSPLPYEQRLQARPIEAIVRVIVHCTETPDLAGSIHRYVTLARIAHHVVGHNADSIGIELVNRGRWPHWLDSRHQAMDEAYPEAQIAALIALIGDLKARLPNLREIAGHEDLDTRRVPASDDPNREVARKRDPGPLFPWRRVLRETGLRRVPDSVPSPDATVEAER